MITKRDKEKIAKAIEKERRREEILFSCETFETWLKMRFPEYSIDEDIQQLFDYAKQLF